MRLEIPLFARRIPTLAYLAIVLTAPHAYGERGAALWTNRYSGPIARANQAQAIAIDNNQNVFVTGYCYKPPNPVSGRANDDYATVAYSSAGLPLWTNFYNGPASLGDYARAIAVDNSGNVYVTGESNGSPNPYAYNYDYLTIKYSNAGVPLWTNRYKGPIDGEDKAKAITVDNKGRVFVTGTAGTLLNGTAQTIDADITTIAISPVGVTLWARRYNGPANLVDTPAAIVLDGSENVFITGEAAAGSALDFNTDFVTLGYSNSGGSLWTNRYRGPVGSTNSARAIAVDQAGNVCVMGDSMGAGTGSDLVTLKYSRSGTSLWTNRFDGVKHLDDRASQGSLAVDSSGTVFITGQTQHSTDYWDDSDIVTIAYSSSGVASWTNYYGFIVNTGNEYPRGITLDGRGNVFVTGRAYSGGTREWDYVTLAYSNMGAPLWTNLYDGATVYRGTDIPVALVLDNSGNVVVTGGSRGASGYADYVTVKYSTLTPMPVPLNCQKMSNSVVLSWSHPAFGLQSAPSVRGVFTNVPGARSPLTKSLKESIQYFRLIAN